MDHSIVHAWLCMYIMIWTTSLSDADQLSLMQISITGVELNNNL